MAAPLQAQPGAPGKGTAVAIGGALKLDNDAVWQRLVELSGGKNSRWVVLATAAGNPARSGATVVNVLQKHGALAEVLPIAPRLAGTNYQAAARDPALVAKVLAARGVYFTGGAQARITEALLDDKGQPTPVLAAIWQIYRAGGVIAGSSAGAAIMSTQMFRDPPEVLDVMKGGLTEGKHIDRGLGFVGPDIFVDQHFLKRGRFGRMLPLMLAKGYKLGVGVDENTAVIFQGDTLEVVGYKGALMADLTDAASDAHVPAFNLRNVRLSYLDRGDRYQLSTRSATPSKEKLADLKVDPNAPGFKPHFTGDAFYTDVLGDTTVANLMGNLIDNAQREVTALAFGGPASIKPELGFEFRFRKGVDSLGYYTGAFGGEDYSVFNIYLDITPISLSQPLYRPLQAARP
nr:cyanophycinase [uncultured Roseateles sp.]